MCRAAWQPCGFRTLTSDLFRIRIIVMIMALALTLARPGANKLLTKTKLSAVLQNTLPIKFMNLSTKHLDALSAARACVYSMHV